MNWRGILGIYAGFAVVIGGGWLWMRSGATWTLGIIALGVVIALASVVQIVLAKRGPRPAKEPKPAKAAKGKAVAADDDDMDAAVKARLAAIAGRSSGKPVFEEPVAELQAFAETDASDASIDEVVEPVAAQLEEVAYDASLPDEPNEWDVAQEPSAEPVAEFAPTPWDEPTPAVVEVQDLGDAEIPSGAWYDAAPAGAEVAEIEAEVPTVDPWAAEAPLVDDIDAEEEVEVPLADDPWAVQAASVQCATSADESDRFEPVDAVNAELAPAEPAQVEVAEPTLTLDKQPGFPWTARYIALWAQEVRDYSPEPFRDAVAHWQRWAVQQSAGTPIVEEATEEFRAMIDIWRADFGDVPDLAANDWPMRQLYREAEEDDGLAALLPAVGY